MKEVLKLEKRNATHQKESDSDFHDTLNIHMILRVEKSVCQRNGNNTNWK